MGLGRFSECGLVNCLLWLGKWINIGLHTYITITSPSVYWPHHPVWVSTESTRLRELCFVISVCLPWVCYCASLPDEVCQRARGSSRCPSRCSSRCPESPDVEPPCQMVEVPVHKIVLMVRFICLWWYCLFYSLMWRPIGCVCHHCIVL